MSEDVVPLKRLVSSARQITYGIVQCGEDVADGIPYIRPVDMGDEMGAPVSSLRRTSPEIAAAYRRSTVRPGDLIVSIGPSFGKVMIAELEHAGANLTQGTALVVPGPHLHPRYLFWVLRSSAVKQFWDAESSGATFRALTLDTLARTPVPVMRCREQRAIADFLDRETARIDDLIRMQSCLDELLVESRKSMVAKTVCRGTNLSATLADSGVGWLGATPSDWRLAPVKRLFRLIVNPAPDDHGMELLSLYTDVGVRPRKELEERGNKASTTDGYFTVRRGDFIFNKLLAWMGAIGLSNYDGVTSPAYDILRPIVPMVARYYDYLFRCGICLPEFRRHSRGIMDMRLRLYFNKLGPLLMPYPPIEEQRRIVEFLDRETSKIDEIRSSVSRCVEKLGEYRSALISAAVTGQIDIRNYRPQEAAAACP